MTSTRRKWSRLRSGLHVLRVGGVLRAEASSCPHAWGVKVDGEFIGQARKLAEAKTMVRLYLAGEPVDSVLYCVCARGTVMPEDDSPWDSSQVRTFVHDARSVVGGPKGWSAIGPTLQRALLEARTARVIMSQVGDAVIRPAHARSLYRSMLREAGLDED